MILNIVTEPNPILHKKAKPLTKNELKTDAIRALILDLKETMTAKDGVGLAAVQVGADAQICVISKNYIAGKKDDLVLINPKWEKASIAREWMEEGCLSVPQIYGMVKRYKKIKVEAMDENGKDMIFIISGFASQIIQHETDHLNGVLFIEKAKNLHRVEDKKEQTEKI